MIEPKICSVLRAPDSPALHTYPAATILAAGLGRRLGGRAKASLHIGDTSLMERLASALRGAGIDDISVVIGPYAEALLPLIKRCGAQALPHGRPDTSLVESQRLAVRSHVDQHPGQDLLVILADLPLLNAADIHRLLEEWWQRPITVHAQMPVVNGVRGHPLLLSPTAVQEVAATPAHLGIRDWLSTHPDLISAFVTQQRAYITDLDSPNDLSDLEILLRPQLVFWPAP